jgi:hypothetical protein
MIDINDVLPIVEEAGSTYYKIEDFSRAKKSGNHIVSFAPEDADGNPVDNGDNAETLQHLEVALSRLKDGKYVIRHYKQDKNKSRGHAELSFMRGEPAARPGQNYGQRNNAIGGLNGIGVLDQFGGIAGMVTQQVQTALLTKENAELKARNEELEAESEDPSGLKTGVGMLTNAIQATPNGEKLFQMMIGGVMGKLGGMFTPGFAGTAVAQPTADVDLPDTYPDTNTPTNQNTNTVSIPEERREEVNQWLQANGSEITGVAAELYILDRDCLSLLKKIIAKEKASPGTIAMAKNLF